MKRITKHIPVFLVLIGFLTTMVLVAVPIDNSKGADNSQEEYDEQGSMESTVPYAFVYS